MRGGTFDDGLTLALGALCVDNIVTILPFANQLRYQFRRILQVGIDDDNRVASGLVQAGAESDFLAEISAQIEQRNTIVYFPERVYPFQRAIDAAVIDIDDLEIEWLADGTLKVDLRLAVLAPNGGELCLGVLDIPILSQVVSDQSVQGRLNLGKQRFNFC